MALRQSGYRAAARVAGEYVGSARFESCGAAANLEGLAHFSTIVIVGQIGENRPHLSADGREITTDFRVTVLETVKGPVSVGDTISVAISGGKIVFEDGTSAELRPGDFRVPESGERYVFFLQRSWYRPSAEAEKYAGRSGVWSPVLASQGLFAITDLSRVRPAARLLYPVALKYRDADYARFMADVYSAVSASRR